MTTVTSEHVTPPSVANVEVPGSTAQVQIPPRRLVFQVTDHGSAPPVPKGMWYGIGALSVALLLALGFLIWYAARADVNSNKATITTQGNLPATATLGVQPEPCGLLCQQKAKDDAAEIARLRTEVDAAKKAAEKVADEAKKTQPVVATQTKTTSGRASQTVTHIHTHNHFGDSGPSCVGMKTDSDRAACAQYFAARGVKPTP